MFVVIWSNCLMAVIVAGLPMLLDSQPRLLPVAVDVL